MQSIVQFNTASQPIIQVNNFPDDFRAPELKEDRYVLNHKDAYAEVYEIAFNNFNINYKKSFINHDFQFDIRYDFPLLKMHFELEGYSAYHSFDRKKKDIIISAGRHQLFYHPSVNGRLSYNQNRTSFEIMLTTGFLKKVFGENLEALQQFGKVVLSQKQALLNDESMPISQAMRTIINEMINCSLTGRLKEIYLETKITELLITQVQQKQSYKTDFYLSDNYAFKKPDIHKLEHAKYIIETNLEAPLTIKELAKRTGLNTLKLKTGFRVVFETTVFGHLSEMRMSKAHQLLLQGDHSIAEVSIMVGYKNPQHFSAAFKKRYGLLPKHIKAI